MSISVNTNYGAYVALQYLNKTNDELDKVQTRLNTGLRVNGPQDDAAVFAIANRLKSDVKGFNAVQSNLDRNIAAMDTAVSAAQSIFDLLGEMKSVAIAARDSSIDANARNSYNSAFGALRDQIKTIITNASFDGTNLISSSTTVKAMADTRGTTFSIALKNLTANGATNNVLKYSAAASVSTAAKASTQVINLSTSMVNLGLELARMGGFQKQLSMQKSFVTKLTDTFENSISNMIDADVARDSAKLQALQIKQQLGVQALSIANQAPNTLLSLFR